jgi:hypothetical protein
MGDVGKAIRIGQWLNGDGYKDYEHVLMYMGDGKIAQAQPHGAAIRDLSIYDGRTIRWSSGLINPTDDQRAAIVAAAQRYADLHVGYSYLDYAALATHRLHLYPADQLLKDYIASNKHMICSQYIDQCYQDGGYQLFDDHRWPGYVTPGSITCLLDKLYYQQTVNTLFTK